MEAYGLQLVSVTTTAKSYVLRNRVQRLERTETAWMKVKNRRNWAKYQSFRDIIAMGFATKRFESAVKRLKSYMILNKIKKESFASSSNQATMMTKTNTFNRFSPLCLTPLLLLSARSTQVRLLFALVSFLSIVSHSASSAFCSLDSGSLALRSRRQFTLIVS
ncbi:hypothetical protein PGT21_015048 [Puccinia graminis f. sp. tritici]|uniref:Uncharacterized protein n=1 Tax=Puccinia graminis f. sp. tritici TaxID=56615 RepID=A0A5B0PXL8_PUCGR|nr:hypothetical protein PGT21_015048 [Puccinia graminis f. sp. tritici]